VAQPEQRPDRNLLTWRAGNRFLVTIYKIGVIFQDAFRAPEILYTRDLANRNKQTNKTKGTNMKTQSKPGMVVLAATLMGAILLLEGTVRVASAAPPTGIKNVVLVHGAFADGSGWEAVAKILEKDGYKVSVAQPPETSYADDQKYTKAAIDAMGGPVVLVGHSYGGSIITEAGNDTNVAALVYIAAFALDEGESCASIEQALPQASKAFKPDSDGNWWIEQDHFAADFAADIPPEKAAFMAVAQVPISTDAFTHKVTSPAWKTKPTSYMVATEDRSINPDQERMMAKRANAKTVEVKASHVAYMSHPKETAKLIEEAATSVPVNQ
jgi:pimeloyl-ACP methyl ester carboxylesterase